MVPIRCQLVHHIRQTVERLKYGAGWNPLGLVFCTLVGTTINENNFRNRDYTSIVNKAGVRYINPHAGGRHTGATQMRKAGASLCDMQDWLGHSSIATTNDIYAHPSDDPGKSIRDKMQ